MFNYNPDTHQITREEGGEYVGLYLPDSQQIALSVDLSNVHKGKLKAGLIEAGLEVKGFEKVADISPTHPDNQATPSPADVPPCPAEDLRYGDKTPEVVEWYRRYHPGEFKRRYEGRKIG